MQQQFWDLLVKFWLLLFITTIIIIYYTLLNCTVAFRVFVVDNGCKREFSPPTRPHAAGESRFYMSTIRSRAVTEPTTFWLQNNKTKSSLPSLISGVDDFHIHFPPVSCWLLGEWLKGRRSSDSWWCFLYCVHRWTKIMRFAATAGPSNAHHHY